MLLTIRWLPVGVSAVVTSPVEQPPLERKAIASEQEWRGWKPGLPTGWDMAASSVQDFPLANRTYLINPWKYSERLGVYKVLIRSTARLHFEGDTQADPLWGLPLQVWAAITARLLML